MVFLRADRDVPLEIDGYGRLLRARNISMGDTSRTITGQGITYRIGKDLRTMTVAVSHDTNAADSLRIDLRPLVDKLIAEYGNSSTDRIPPEKMSIVAASDAAAVKIFIPFLRIKRHALFAYNDETKICILT